MAKDDSEGRYVEAHGEIIEQFCMALLAGDEQRAAQARAEAHDVLDAFYNFAADRIRERRDRLIAFGLL